MQHEAGPLEEELLHFLSELSHYFKEPEKVGVSEAEYRQELRVLWERQVLFRRQGALQFMLTVIMGLSECNHKGTVLVEKKLYKLLGEHGLFLMCGCGMWVWLCCSGHLCV